MSSAFSQRSERFLTAVASEVKHIFHAYEVGAVDYLVKPVEPPIVRKKVEVFARLARQRRQIEAQAEALNLAQQREYEHRLAQMRLASDARYRKLVEGIDHAIAWSADATLSQFSFVSRQAELLLGFSHEEWAEPGFFARNVHPDDRGVFFQAAERAASTGQDQQCNHRLFDATGDIKWFHTGMSSETGDAREDATMHGITVDITDVKAAEYTERYMSEATTTLAACPDYKAALARIASLAVPQLADWCLVDEVTAPMQLRQSGAYHVDPTKHALLHALDRQVVDVVPGSLFESALSTGEPIVMETLDDPDAFVRALGMEPTDIVPSVGATSCLVLPLRSSNGALGIVTLVMCAPGRRFTQGRIDQAREVFRRAGMILENLRLRAEAERSKALRDDVLMIVSHDLRNPLTSIATAAGAIRTKTGPDLVGKKIHNYAGLILRATAHAEALIRDLLDVARIDAGQVSVCIKAVEGRELLERAVEQFSLAAKDKSIRLTTEIPEDPTYIDCDEGRVLQTLGNLISNALRFTPCEGRVTLRMKVVQDEALFEVSDTGPGLTEEQRAHVFERYWRAEKRDASGIGIGLNISKGLIKAQGGRIWTERKDKGATFCFTLPLARCAAATDGEDAARQLSQS